MRLRNPLPRTQAIDEEQSLLTLPSAGGGGDACTYMTEDQVYAVTSSMAGDVANTQRMWGLGSVWDLG